MRAAAFATLIAGFLLAGCAHVPLGTLWKLRSFGPEDFVALNPADLRAAVRAPTAFVFAKEGHELQVVLIEDGRTAVDATAALAIEASVAGVSNLKPRDGATWRVMRLTPEGERALGRIQAAVARLKPGTRKEFQLTVVPAMRFDKPAAPGRVGEPSVGLRMAPGGGFVMLVEDYPLEVTAEMLAPAAN
jgi:hypothetical protein